MKTKGDKPAWTCYSCAFCGDETIEINDIECVECRLKHPGGSSFPIMNINSWCWEGQISETKVHELICRG